MTIICVRFCLANDHRCCTLDYVWKCHSIRRTSPICTPLVSSTLFNGRKLNNLSLSFRWNWTIFYLKKYFKLHLGHKRIKFVVEALKVNNIWISYTGRVRMWATSESIRYDDAAEGCKNSPIHIFSHHENHRRLIQLLDLNPKYINLAPVHEEFKDIKGVIRICRSKDRQHNDLKQKDKQWSTKYYTEN